MTGGASYNTFRHTASMAAVLEYQKYGLVIVQEYLSHELGEKLEAKLGMPVEEKVKPEVTKGNKRTSLDQEDTLSKTKMKVEIEGNWCTFDINSHG